MTGTLPEVSRHIPLEGNFNLRDVGGYAAATGVTRWQKLYRSDSLHQLSDADQRELQRRAVQLVIDLRDEEERTAFPSILGGVNVRIQHNPIFTTPASVHIANDSSLNDLYDDVVANSGDRIADAVRWIANSEDTAVIVHCTAGKDRTGLVVAFALIASGVERACVVQDYACTEQHLPVNLLDSIILRLRAERIESAVNLDELVRRSPARVLERILDRVDVRFGSVAGFLHQHGLSHDDLVRLRHVLVEPEGRTSPG